YFLLIAVACIIVLYYEYWWDFKFPTEQNSHLYFYGLLNAVHIWTLILGILGMAKRHLNFSNAFLKYSNEAVYPLYILHQTLILIFGYYVAKWDLSITLKLIILVVLCFISLMLIYELLIKRFTITRLLYGLKVKKKIKYPVAKTILSHEQVIS